MCKTIKMLKRLKEGKTGMDSHILQTLFPDPKAQRFPPHLPMALGNQVWKRLDSD